MKEECRNCKYYTRLYIPPIFEEIRKTLDNTRVCTALLYEGPEVMFLGKADEADKEMCEMFTEKGKTK